MEVWKDIPNYEGYYQVSNLGRVKSLQRKVKHSSGGIKITTEKILKPSVGSNFYLHIILSKDNKKIYKIHQLVAMAFLNHTPNGHKLVVDHINNIRTDNRLENLQIITHRENSVKNMKRGVSNYVGVCWAKRNKKWRATIRLNNIIKHLGFFINEIDAHNAYQDALKKLQNESK
jgi:hypothetical protein